ncbi:MAG: flagellar biosynthetic protein FliO [Azoarcus sp.]|jgi:flagellar protein FliO/FliZ|nr:flagellar biosynthetic protein FliO [Azoarcus sp.]
MMKPSLKPSAAARAFLKNIVTGACHAAPRVDVFAGAPCVRAFLAAVLLACAGTSRAMLESAPPPTLPPSPLAGTGQMLFGLVLVLAVLAGCVWLLKRFSVPLRGNGMLRIIGVTALGPREKVVLLEAGDKVMMLGVTPNNVRTLHIFSRDELKLPIASAAASADAPAASPLACFANRLRDAIKARRNAS